MTLTAKNFNIMEAVLLLAEVRRFFILKKLSILIINQKNIFRTSNGERIPQSIQFLQKIGQILRKDFPTF
jgi:hypothetical protein